MAIVQNPLIGDARGSLGNTVFSKQFGKNTLRTKPINPKVGRSPGQQLTRERFNLLLPLLRQVLRFINDAYAGSVVGMSTHNRVMSLNMNNCFAEGTASIEPGLFVLCEHDGSFVENVVLSSTTENTITATFTSNAQNADEEGDPVIAYGFDVEGNKIWKFDQIAIRNSGTITLSKTLISGLNIAVYFECLDRVKLLNDKPKHVIKYVGSIQV